MSINIDMIIFDPRLVLRHFLIPLIMKLVSICLLCITQIIILCTLWTVISCSDQREDSHLMQRSEGGQSSHVAIRGRTIVSCSDQREDNRLMQQLEGGQLSNVETRGRKIVSCSDQREVEYNNWIIQVLSLAIKIKS